jgi:hypothetical protein
MADNLHTPIKMKISGNMDFDVLKLNPLSVFQKNIRLAHENSVKFDFLLKKAHFQKKMCEIFTLCPIMFLAFIARNTVNFGILD